MNSTPVVYRGVVAVGTNSRLALGYEAATGTLAWRHRLDGPCTNAAPAGPGKALLWTSASAYLFRVADGSLLGRWTKRNHDISHACMARKTVLVVTQQVWGERRETWPIAVLRAYRADRERYAMPYPRWSPAALRFEPATGRVYEATNRGLGILDPASGEREVVINGFGESEYSGEQVGVPAVVDGRLYVMNDRGRVFCLRHP